MKAYKGFNADMTCRGFQYEPGKEYEEPGADLCSKGFHACEAPLDCFGYYVPGSSVYREVDLEDVSEQRDGSDTKRVGKRIKIGAALNVAGICKAQFEYVKAHTTFENTDPNQATAGDSGAATAGNYGAATARGSVTVGKNGCGLVRGADVKARGGLGAVLVICIEDMFGDIVSVKTITVDGEKNKAKCLVHR